MSYIELFLPGATHKPLVKPRVVALEADWELVISVFPEPGFRSYFLGQVIHKLAEELRKNGITTYYERSDRSDLADVTRLVPDFSLVRKKDNRDDNGGTRPACDEDANSKGEPAGAAFSALGKTKEDKDSESGQQTRPLDARSVIYVCPTCKDSRYVELYESRRDKGAYDLYCRKCEEGVVPALAVPYPQAKLAREFGITKPNIIKA